MINDFMVILIFLYSGIQGIDAEETFTHFQKELTCLAHNIYFEAKGESYEGKLAVATVTKNRVRSKYFPNSYCDVVWQVKTYNGRKVPQFSWTLDGKSDRPKDQRAYEKSVKVAAEVLLYDKKSDKISSTVLNYHANYTKPRWSKQMPHAATIGNHEFYEHQLAR